jgi:hypothetical protein
MLRGRCEKVRRIAYYQVPFLTGGMLSNTSDS